MSVTVYTTPTCPYCRQAKEYLRSRQVSFVEKDVSVDPLAAEEMIRQSGQRGVPVLVINGEVIIGFDRARIDAALARGPANRPKLGASVADAARVAPKYGLGIYQGAYVGRVTAGSPADRAGIHAGDVILSLAGRSIQTAEDVQNTVESLQPGQRVRVDIWRNGRQIPLEVVF